MKKLLVLSLILASVAQAENICIDPTSGFTTAPQCSGGAMRVKVDASSMVLNNNTFLQCRDAADAADIDVLKVDGTDDTVLNCDTGDVIKIAEAGTTGITIDPSAATFTFAAPATLGAAASTTNTVKVLYMSDSTGADKWSLVPGTNTLNLAAGTSDAGDDQYLGLASGGSPAATRGAFVGLYGNEGGAGGYATLSTGDKAGSVLQLTAAATDGTIDMRVSGTTLRWQLQADGDLAQDATNGGNIVMAKAGTYANIGAATLSADITGAVGTGGVNVVRSWAATGPSGVFVNVGDDGNGPTLAFYKTDDTDSDADVLVDDGDDLFVFKGYGADGTNYDQAVEIRAEIDGTASGGTDMPGRIVFLTSPDGSATPAEAMRISQDKSITVAGAVKASANTLGWVLATATNGTGTTMCANKGCVICQDTDAATKPLVSCATASAEICVCTQS